jgi:hypothetical protein
MKQKFSREEKRLKKMLIQMDDNGNYREVIYEPGDLEKFSTKKKMLIKVKMGDRRFEHFEKAVWVYINHLLHACVSHVTYLKYVESKMRIF